MHAKSCESGAGLGSVYDFFMSVCVCFHVVKADKTRQEAQRSLDGGVGQTHISLLGVLGSLACFHRCMDVRCGRASGREKEKDRDRHPRSESER